MAVAMGLQVEQREPSIDGGLGNAGVWGPGADAPMGAIGWWTLPCCMEHLGHALFSMAAGAARGLLVVQPCNVLVVKARAPFTHRHLAQAQLLGHLHLGLSLTCNSYPF